MKKQKLPKGLTRKQIEKLVESKKTKSHKFWGIASTIRDDLPTVHVRETSVWIGLADVWKYKDARGDFCHWEHWHRGYDPLYRTKEEAMKAAAVEARNLILDSKKWADKNLETAKKLHRSAYTYLRSVADKFGLKAKDLGL